MLKLGKFDLQLAFGTGGTQGEDIENQAGSVDHATFECPFQIPFLRRRQLVIENHQICLTGRHHGAHFINLAFAGIGLRIRAVPTPADLGNHRTPGGLGQQTHLFQLVFDIELAEVKLNDHRTFTGGGSFDHGRFRKIRPTGNRGGSG